ncbi:helix-turn-helix domain-containing protein [Levilactobacillus brevis]|uniref:Helix-turn-helix domain-containing protein n=2 Tax=Levilactobacillus brevis TaxID=1580 RepID=A0AB38X7D0_LEVBR|nr:helix-turn-helix domain-containing protein [Levilactobacillus brevis]WAD02555.1 helix-turn-helix domain-containing protein [Levilactobacillus brevis]BAN07314.1 ArsR family transcriptional regulator [Levilactobacillus brevis KB290]
MQLDMSSASLPVYEALSSEVRLHIIRLISEKPMSVKELAQELGLSSAIVTKHLDKLAAAELVTSKRVGRSKMTELRVDTIEVKFPREIYPTFQVHQTSIPVGHYTEYRVQPSCGLAGKNGYIGKVDNPRYFMSPERMNAGMIWFNNGYVEYQTPNFLQGHEHLEMLDLTAELGSEFPFSNNTWPSDITFFINGKEIGTWRSLGDFSDIRGKYTPKWVPDNVNQYGVLKTLRVTDHGTYLDGQPFTDICLKDLPIDQETWTVRFEVKENAEKAGGCTIFGQGFGNHDQNIELLAYYS